MSFEGLLTHVFELQAKGAGVSAGGGSVTTWSTVTTIRGREVKFGGSERRSGNQASIGTRNVVLERVDVNGAAYALTHANRLKKGATIYNVLTDAQDAGGAGHHFEVPVEVVT